MGLVASCGCGSASPLSPSSPHHQSCGCWGDAWLHVATGTGCHHPLSSRSISPTSLNRINFLFAALITGSCSLPGRDEVFCRWHKNVFIHRTRSALRANGQLNLKPIPKFPPLAFLPQGVQNQVFPSFGLAGSSHSLRQVRNASIGGRHSRPHMLRLV